VTGATGRVGRAVVAELLGAGVPVRALTRRPDAARLPAAVEVLSGDLTAPESLDAALQDVGAVFLVWTAPPATVPAVIECLASHARRVVLLSSPHRTPHPFFQAPQPNAMAVLHANIERLIAETGLASTIIRPGMFASNALHWWAASIRDGDAVRWPFEELSPEDFRRETTGSWPTPVVDMLLTAWGATIGRPAFVTSTVFDIVGTPARTFRQWVADHADVFRNAQRVTDISHAG
jgi:uncharacterized protein YbjT (DUF2867 family)